MRSGPGGDSESTIGLFSIKRAPCDVHRARVSIFGFRDRDRELLISRQELSHRRFPRCPSRRHGTSVTRRWAFRSRCGRAIPRERNERELHVLASLGAAIAGKLRSAGESRVFVHRSRRQICPPLVRTMEDTSPPCPLLSSHEPSQKGSLCLRPGLRHSQYSTVSVVAHVSSMKPAQSRPLCAAFNGPTWALSSHWSAGMYGTLICTMTAAAGEHIVQLQLGWADMVPC